MRSVILGLCLWLGFWAAAPGTAGAETTIMTGKPAGTYIRFGQDMARLAKEFGIDLPDCPSDAFATAASPSWVTGRAMAGRGIAPIPGVAVAGGGTEKGSGIID